MIWGFLTVIVVGLVLLFAAPFLDFLTPDSTIWLVDLSNSNDPILLAQGANQLSILSCPLGFYQIVEGRGDTDSCTIAQDACSLIIFPIQ